MDCYRCNNEQIRCLQNIYKIQFDTGANQLINYSNNYEQTDDAILPTDKIDNFNPHYEWPNFWIFICDGSVICTIIHRDNAKIYASVLRWLFAVHKCNKRANSIHILRYNFKNVSGYATLYGFGNDCVFDGTFY